MRSLLFAIVLAGAASCTQRAADYQQIFHNPVLYSKVTGQLTDVITYDIFSPPVASRIYAYTHLAAYETMAHGDSSYSSLNGQLKGFAGAPAPEAGKQVDFTAKVHWVKERQLPELDDEFAQQVGEYADLAALREAIEKQLRQSEDERIRDQQQEAALSKLVEISTIEFPPQLLEHQAQHMLETFSRNMEQQGLQLAQYLRLVGKEQDAFEQEVRAEAETRIRRSLALDAFADAEKIGAEAAEGDDQEVTRERRALARLIELATTDGHSTTRKGSQKATEAAQTSDTEGQAPEEERGIA